MNVSGSTEIIRRVVYNGSSVQTIEFPAGVSKLPTRKVGAVHLVPRRLASFTQSELDYLAKHRTDVYKYLSLYPRPSLDSVISHQRAERPSSKKYNGNEKRSRRTRRGKVK